MQFRIQPRALFAAFAALPTPFSLFRFSELPVRSSLSQTLRPRLLLMSSLKPVHIVIFLRQIATRLGLGLISIIDQQCGAHGAGSDHDHDRSVDRRSRIRGSLSQSHNALIERPAAAAASRPRAVADPERAAAARSLGAARSSRSSLGAQSARAAADSVRQSAQCVSAPADCTPGQSVSESVRQRGNGTAGNDGI